MDEILGEFIAETLETLEVLSGEIVAWEADPTDKSRLDAFFRFFHTVKGSCGFLNLPRFERLAHGAEDVLAAVRRGERVADPATVTAVLAVMDRIGALARAIGEDEQTPESEDDKLLDALAMNSGGFEIFEPAQAKKTAASRLAAKDSTPVEADDEDEIKLEPSVESTSRRSGDGAGRGAAPRTIRLPLALIDQLMNGISDMVLARNDLARKMRDHGVDPDLESSFERLSANVADLRDMISKTRMQRVDRLYAAIPRMVRDLTRELGKKANLELDGGDVEMDREMIEMVVDPLTHIVRNALDHGVETPAERAAAGKSEAGTLRLVARQSGNQIIIEMSDDGRGINRRGLVEKAIAAGIYSASEAASLTDAEKLNLIFHAGLSTASHVTSISGRGVGMDIVRANIEQIGGLIGITSVEGDGTTITMRVPLTLTIIPGLIVRCGALFFAMPRGNVVELLHQNSSMVSLETIGGARIATIRGERHSLIELEDALGVARAAETSTPRTLMVIRSSSGQPYVLGVEAVESNEELVIRPASPVITAAGVFAGMTLPDNGQPMLLLDAAGIAQVAALPERDADLRTRAIATAAETEARIETIQVLMYEERDNQRRLLPLAVVDRVEDLGAAQIIRSDGLAFARIEDRLLPTLNTSGGETGDVKSLRLHDGHSQICYIINDVIDIIEVPAQLDVQVGSGRIAGLVMVGDTQLEMVDPFMLFAEAAARRTGTIAAKPIQCVIADVDDPWMRNILAPLLLQAGHDVRFGLAESIGADVILRGDDEAEEIEGDVPILTLRPLADARADSPHSIYRYDRDTLMAAITQAAGKAA